MKKKYFAKALVFVNLFKNRRLTNQDIQDAEQKAPSLAERAEEFRLLIQMGRDTFSGVYKMNTWNLSIIVGTILYVVSPLDAIPDVVPILGWLDDASIVGYAITKLADELDRYRKAIALRTAASKSS